MHGADNVATVGHRRFRHSTRDAEISHFCCLVVHHENVVRLDVAVHEAVCMRVRERLGDFTRDRQRLFRREVAALLDELLERAPRHVLHDDIVVIP